MTLFIGLDLGTLDNTSEADCVAYTRSKDDGLTQCMLIGSGCQCKRRDAFEGCEELNREKD